MGNDKTVLSQVQINEDAALRTVAKQIAAGHAASPKGQKKGLDEYLRELVARRNAVTESIQTVAKWADDEGNIHTEIMPGLYDPGRPGALVRTNFKSRRALALKIDGIIGDVSAALDVLNTGGKLQPDFKLEDYIRINNEAFAKADTNVIETVGKPQSAK